MPKPSTTKPIPAAGVALAVAACSSTLSSGNELQLLPAGQFKARDGRPTDAPCWYLDAALAQVLINAAAARQTPYVTDYEHQTLLAKKTGNPAPAAGWFSKLEWREGVGLFAIDVKWTDRASAMIEADEYKFISPVIGYDKTTGAVTALYMAAITNDPAIDGMDEVLLTAAALHFSLPTPTPLTQENPMEEMLEQLRWLLNMPVGATADDIVAQLQKLIDQVKQDPTATAAASFDLAGYLAAQRASIASLSSAEPDPTKYVPIEAMQAVQTKLASLSSETAAGRVDKLVRDAVAAGKLLPAQEAWARALGNKDMEALSAFIDSAAPIAALSGMQTGGKAPAETLNAAGLTEHQVALCAAMGVSEEAFAATLKAEQS